LFKRNLLIFSPRKAQLSARRCYTLTEA